MIIASYLPIVFVLNSIPYSNLWLDTSSFDLESEWGLYDEINYM